MPRVFWPAGHSAQLIPLAGQQFPAPILLRPGFQRADLDAVGLAVRFALGNVEVTRNRGGADDRDLQLWKVDRFDDRLAGHYTVDDRGLVLDPPVGMAVAQLIAEKLFQFRLVLRQS